MTESLDWLFAAETDCETMTALDCKTARAGAHESIGVSDPLEPSPRQGLTQSCTLG